jgi:hypothetical protein
MVPMLPTAIQPLTIAGSRSPTHFVIAAKGGQAEAATSFNRLLCVGAF